MIEEILKAFKYRIKKHEWIDEKTRDGVMEKVRITYVFLSVICLSINSENIQTFHLQYVSVP